jgi:hypothetical protein
LGKSNGKEKYKKYYAKSYRSFAWECSAPFAADGLGVYHYAMISTMETGDKLLYISIFCFGLDTSF